MKNAFFLLSAAAFAALAAVAGAEDEIVPLDKKNGYAVMDVWYAPFDKHDFDLSGGGYHVGGEYVDSDLPAGIGGRIGNGFYFGSDKSAGGVKFEDLFAADFLFDAYVPLRLSEYATVYGGAGACAFLESADYSAVVYRGRRPYKVSGSVETSGLPVLFSAFLGVRVRFENVFAFAEWRNDFKKDVKFAWKADGSSYETEAKYERGGGRVFLGIGFEFGGK